MSKTHQIFDLRKQLNNVLEAYSDKEYQLEQYKEVSNARYIVENNDAYWSWQPNEEENHLESLTCPIVIPAEWLRNLIDEAYMNGMIEARRLELDYRHNE